MKRYKYIIPALSAALLMTACDKREPMPELLTDGMRACTFRASSEQATKAYVDGLSVLWDNGDEIALFDDAGSEKSVLTLESGAGTKSATFKGTVSGKMLTVKNMFLSNDEKYNTTGITTLTNDVVEQRKGVFDLQGRRMERPTKPGMYIINGRKVIIK